MPIMMGSSVSGSEEGIALDALVNNTSNDMLISTSQTLVGGVREVNISWTDSTVYIEDIGYSLEAGTITLNTADVLNPTTYFVYVRITGGVPEVVSSLTNPEVDPTVDYNYTWIAIVRFKSISGTATVYYILRAYCNIQLLMHYISEYDIVNTPQWVTGGGLTINSTSGTVSMEALEYRRMRFDKEIEAITNGAILIEDESAAYANLELVATYSDGSAITAGKYHKLLFGGITGLPPSYPFLVVRQGKPDTEYTSLDEALTDSERVAASSFPVSYRGCIFPLAFVIMKVGDASDLTTVDLRSTGIVGIGGGGVPISDHGLLTGLGDDDHPQYLLADGSRDLTGNLAVSNGVTIDGVDISARDHNAVTLNAAADGVLGLSTQQITLDNQNANTVFAGPASGAAAVPTFRALTSDDLSKAYGTVYVADGIATQALTANTPVKLSLFATNGISLNTTPDHTNDRITVTNAGDYYVSGHFSGKSSVNNTVFQFHAAVGGVSSYLGAHKKIAAAGDEGSCSFAGGLTLGAGAVITVNIIADKTTNFTLIDSQLNVVRLA